MLYPMKFSPVYKEYLWGGETLKSHFGRELVNGSAAESWDIACHHNGMSQVHNGPLKGLPLEALFVYYGEALLGNQNDKYKKFPLLIKLIDAKRRLSLQVHPEDLYAKEYEDGELGKNEMWYVIKAEPNAKLSIGLKEGVTKTMFEKALKEGTLEELINEVPVKAGDVFDIKAGLLHAIGDGILIAEVQQNSDTTYRVYDWNRVGDDGKPRALHIEKALDVIDFDYKISTDKVEGKVSKIDTHTKIQYIENDYFVIDELRLLGIYKHEEPCNVMEIFVCIEGAFNVNWEDTFIHVKAGESILIPACVASYQLLGDAKILRATLPEEK